MKGSRYLARWLGRHRGWIVALLVGEIVAALSVGLPGRGSAQYLVSGRVANGLLKVRRGAVEEIGIADRGLTCNARRLRTLLASFG